MKEQYIKNLELKHNKKLRKKLQDFVSEETLNSPEFAKHARARFLRKRLIDLAGHILEFKNTMDNKKAGVLRLVARDYIMEILPEFKKVVRQYKYLFASKIKEGITDQDIENAKLYPITDILGEPENKRFTCIFHSPDNNPSLHYYKKTNSVHCFSCGEGGDSIAVYMKVNNVDFITAVNQLK